MAKKILIKHGKSVKKDVEESAGTKMLTKYRKWLSKRM